MKYGPWGNEGDCVPTSTELPPCGPGTQLQIRNCTDGTVEKCAEDDMQRTITCDAAGMPLPACEGNRNV